MKRCGFLFETLVSWPNLLMAAARARRGKRFRPNVADFEFNVEYELLRIQSELTQGTYELGRYRTFIIHEPKRRQISAAPYRDRVVHHAVCNVIEPLFEPTFVSDSYACRRGKGTHAALNRATQFTRKFRYVLQGDIQQFFPTVDHEILLDRLRRKLKDQRVLRIVEQIVRHHFPAQRAPSWFAGDNLFVPLECVCGLPIDNQTSQFFGNVMLNPLDHFAKEKLRRRGYVRYADDFLIFGDDKAELHDVRRSVRYFLQTLRLRLHDDKTVIFPVKNGIPFLGFRLFPTHRQLGRRNTVRFRRRLLQMQRQYAAGEISSEDVRQRIVSWWGHAQHADAWRYAARLLAGYPFVRSAGDYIPST